MIVRETYGDVTRLRFSSAGSRLVGMDVSVYLTRGVFVDTAFPRVSAEMAALVRELRPRGAMITHWHEDHAGNVPLLAAMGVPLWLAPETERIMRERPRIRAYRLLVWGRPGALATAVAPFSDETLVALSTPGHADDHHVIWDAERETVFTGDLWLGVRSRAMHPHEDPWEIAESLRRVMALGPKRMFDAHRGMVEKPMARLRARIDWLDTTIGEIERRHRAGDSERAIMRAVLGGEERSALVSGGEYARRNFVRIVISRVAGRAHR